MDGKEFVEGVDFHITHNHPMGMVRGQEQYSAIMQQSYGTAAVPLRQEPVGGMKNVPKKIYLQVDADGETPEDFNELMSIDVSWCADRIHPNDIEYTLTPPHAGFSSSQKLKNANELFRDDFQAYADRILRDKGASNKDVFDAINDTIQELSKKYNITILASLPSSSVTGEESWKEVIINRISEFQKIYHANEAGRLTLALKAIEELIPPSYFKSLPVTGESEAIEVVDGYTLINIDKRTLPKDGQKVEFENDHEDTYEGYYIEKEGMFHVTDSIFFFAWHVHKWKAI